MAAVSRLLAYWITVFATCWTVTFIYLCNAERAFRRFDDTSDKIFIAIKTEKVLQWSTNLIGFMTPLLIAASLSSFLLTSATLPSWRLSMINKVINRIRNFQSKDAELGVTLYKKNQFGVGNPNFNHVALWLIFLPGMIYFFTFAKINTVYHVNDDIIPEGKSLYQFRVECISNTAAWAGTIVLSFFLIPVTRHSVLLTALNWSPVHALRIHIWAGYTSFLFISLHGILWVYVWFKWTEGPMYREFVPPLDCWQGKDEPKSNCKRQFYNFTGLVAFFFFLVLWMTSLSWFRRKYYTLFYMMHVTCGSFMMLGAIWHFEYIALYLLPSILYYLASTMPTLIQGLTSYFRSGVKIAQVVLLDDAGDCFEIRIHVNESAKEVLVGNHPSMYIKLCCPGISLVWHPFTVFHHPADASTMRLLIRPAGKFTNSLRENLITTSCPVVLSDGFYRGGDHSEQALMCHDHLSIITGGVAITPVISTMFVILQKLSRSMVTNERSMYSLKSLTLIWSCREEGLVKYVKQEYLEYMAHIASNIPEFDFTIKLFYTGGNMKVNTSTVHSESVDSDFICNSLSIGKKQQITNDCNPNNLDDTLDEKCNPIQYSVYFPDRKGHAMEVSRMMPARFANIQSNIPFSVMYACSLWLGFHIMFATYDYSAESAYSGKSEQVWVTILLICFFLLVGMLKECAAHFARSKSVGDNCCDSLSCGKSIPDQNAKIPYLYEVDSYEVDVDDILDLYSTAFEEYYSRPNGDDYLLDAQTSSSPAIFLCAPPPMAESIRNAVRDENSSFLSVRYVIYEESFVM